MRRKIAKRCRREILRAGGVITEEKWIREPGWQRKDCGFGTKVICNGWNICSIGKDELESYKMALDCVKHDCDEPFQPPVKNGDGDSADG